MKKNKLTAVQRQIRYLKKRKTKLNKIAMDLGENSWFCLETKIIHGKLTVTKNDG